MDAVPDDHRLVSIGLPVNTKRHYFSHEPATVTSCKLHNFSAMPAAVQSLYDTTKHGGPFLNANALPGRIALDWPLSTVGTQSLQD